MNNRHKEIRIWYAIIVDRRTTYIGSALILRDRIMDSNTKIQHHNNNSGMYQRAQEEAHLRDNHNLRVTKGEKVRVRRVRMMPRTSILREKEVRGKVAQARRQRKNGITTTLSTQMMTMDMMRMHQKTRRKSKKTQKRRTRRKNPTDLSMSGVDKKTRKSQNLLRTTSR